jgi:hypothetical protein
MRECAMQAGHRRIAEFMKVTEDVGFRLCKIGRMPLDVKPNPVGGAVDAEYQFETHQAQGYVKGLDGI